MSDIFFKKNKRRKRNEKIILCNGASDPFVCRASIHSAGKCSY